MEKNVTNEPRTLVPKDRDGVNAAVLRTGPENYGDWWDRLSEVLEPLVSRAVQLSRTRCPYKNRSDRCTADFGCRNKQKSVEIEQLPKCGGDDKVDYRPAWEPKD